ncbi:MAG: hypothetical protein GXN93_03045 [Candidatus Diapherotrites archaeon]|nr:hypothetical protein [Candidatus Diapherotrites archaeon]
MLKPITRLAYRYFGSYVHRHRASLRRFAERLKIARLPYSVEEYVAAIALLTILAFITSFSSAFFLLYRIYSYSVGVSVALALAISISLSGLVALGLIGYPGYLISQRKQDIDARITYATTHMATLAGTGIPVLAIFRAITKFKEYGEISRECEFIVRDVELFGKDIYSAIADAARYSPSRVWAELLWGMVSTLRSGGNLRAYLSERAKAYVQMHEEEEKRAMEALNVVTEIYMVLFVLAPIVGVIMVVFMSMMGGSVFGMSARSFLIFLVYLLLPIVGIIFIILAESQKPKEVI